MGGNTTANMLGGTSWGDERWNGGLDDLRAYGRALTQAEVTDLHTG
ncbi:LamG-like jellyroll fold domain-containing protein [Nocardioides sp.]